MSRMIIKLTIASLVFVVAGSASLAEPVTPILNHSPSEIHTFCGITGGSFYGTGKGTYGCTANDGNSAVECNSKQQCKKYVYRVGGGRTDATPVLSQ